MAYYKFCIKLVLVVSLKLHFYLVLLFLNIKLLQDLMIAMTSRFIVCPLIDQIVSTLYQVLIQVSEIDPEKDKKPYPYSQSSCVLESGRDMGVQVQ